MKKSDAAAENFKGTCNCCQAVFLAFCKDYGMDEEDAFRVAAGFGGGMGRMQEVCGALTGAFMAIGLKYHDDKKECYRMVREMGRRFREMNGALTCRELLGHDLNTPEGEAAAAEDDVFKKVCPGLVASSAEILSEMVESE